MDYIATRKICGVLAGDAYNMHASKRATCGGRLQCLRHTDEVSAGVLQHLGVDRSGGVLLSIFGSDRPTKRSSCKLPIDTTVAAYCERGRVLVGGVDTVNETAVYE